VVKGRREISLLLPGFVRNAPADVQGSNCPRTISLMFLKVIHGAQQVDMFSDCDSRTDAEKLSGASFQKACIASLQNQMQVATLRAIHGPPSR